MRAGFVFPHCGIWEYFSNTSPKEKKLLQKLRSLSRCRTAFDRVCGSDGGVIVKRWQWLCWWSVEVKSGSNQIYFPCPEIFSYPSAILTPTSLSSPLLPPTLLPAGPADGFLQMCRAAIGRVDLFPRWPQSHRLTFPPLMQGRAQGIMGEAVMAVHLPASW